MRKLLPLLVCFLALTLVPLAASAQEEKLENLQVGIETGTQLLADIPITHFEDADSWSANMSVDQGVIVGMARRGRPLEVPQIDSNDGTKSDYVLGAKVMFNQRGYATFTVTPPKPIKIPGITKAISVWVCGRSFNHRLYVHLFDYKGSLMILDMGPVDFVGWKKMSIAIPSHIAQDNYHSTEWRGLSFAGMSVRCDPEESYGVYYAYFDELRAVTDIYNEEYRDEDDMSDGW
jgi:hypothetical protein